MEYEHTAPKLSIITVGTNEKELLAACLGSVYANPPAAPFEMILVDNVSNDGTGEMVRQSFPQVSIIRNSRRLGYPRNGNIGIRASRGRYVLMLNPDIEVRPGAFDALISFMDLHPEAGIAGAKLLNPDGTLQYSCRGYSRPYMPILRVLGLDRLFPGAQMFREYLMSDWDHGEPREVDWLLGACLIVRREAMTQVGLMEESLFVNYCDDQDWCYRMWQHGWKVYYVPEAVMIHRHLRASARHLFSRARWQHIQSLIRFFKKHGLWLERPQAKSRELR